MQADWISALVGGAIIAVSVSIMLWGSGRVTGISGIIGGLLDLTPGDKSWRVSFLIGMLLGGMGLSLFYPQMYQGALDTPRWTQAVAGLLVGFGTMMGSGCTSGHGVCGISRLSPRSLVATATFIASGVVAVAFFRAVGVFL